jgi:hypothetical protein
VQEGLELVNCLKLPIMISSRDEETLEIIEFIFGTLRRASSSLILFSLISESLENSEKSKVTLSLIMAS